MLMIAVAGIVGNGGASYIARCMGAGETDKARHVLTNGLELIVIFSVVITAFGLLFINPVENVFWAKMNTCESTRDYTCVMLSNRLKRNRPSSCCDINSFICLQKYKEGLL